MASWYTNRHETKDKQKARERKLREVGYDDGYAGEEPRYIDAVYQQAWRRGQEAWVAEQQS